MLLAEALSYSLGGGAVGGGREEGKEGVGGAEERFAGADELHCGCADGAVASWIVFLIDAFPRLRSSEVSGQTAAGLSRRHLTFFFNRETIHIHTTIPHEVTITRSDCAHDSDTLIFSVGKKRLHLQRQHKSHPHHGLQLRRSARLWRSPRHASSARNGCSSWYGRLTTRDAESTVSSTARHELQCAGDSHGRRAARKRSPR